MGNSIRHICAGKTSRPVAQHINLQRFTALNEIHAFALTSLHVPGNLVILYSIMHALGWFAPFFGNVRLLDYASAASLHFSLQKPMPAY